MGTSTDGLLPGADPCNEPPAPSAPPRHIEPLVWRLSCGSSLDWPFCDPPSSTMSLPAAVSVDQGERGLETAASVFQVERGGRVRACCSRSPIVLRYCDRESDCPVSAWE